MAKLPYDYPNRKVVIISTDDPFGQETANGLEENAKDAGWEVVMRETVPYGTREWGPILTKIRAIKPAWIHVEDALAPDLITFYQQFIKSPTPSLIHFGYGLTLPDFMSNMGKSANGLLGYGVMIPDPPITPESALWVKRFTDIYGATPVAASFPVYTGVMIWAEAVKSVGDVGNYAAVNEYIAKNKFKTLEGREVWFDKDHKIPISIWPANWVQIQNEKMVTLFLSTADKKNQAPYKKFKVSGTTVDKITGLQR